MKQNNHIKIVKINFTFVPASAGSKVAC